MWPIQVCAFSPIIIWYYLKSRGCRKLKRGNKGVPVYMSVARFAGVVSLLLLYRADAFEIQSKCGWELSLCSGWHAHVVRTHRSTVRSFHKLITLKYIRLLLCRGFHSVKSLRCDTGTHTAAADCMEKMKKSNKRLNGVSVLETVPGSYCCRILQ